MLFSMFSLYPQYTQLTMLTTKRLWKKKISVVIADEHVWDLFELATEEEEEEKKNTHAKKQNGFFSMEEHIIFHSWTPIVYFFTRSTPSIGVKSGKLNSTSLWKKSNILYIILPF